MSLPPRSRLLHAVIAVLGLTLPAASARAETPAGTAAAVHAAFAARDEVRLQQLASEHAGSAWLIVDALEALDALPAAQAFSALLPEDDAAALAAYLRGRGPAVSPEARKALDEAQALLAAGAFAAALAALQATSPPEGSILALRVLLARGLAERGLGHLGAATTALQGVGRTAEAWGWVQGAILALELAGDSARRTGDLARAREAWTHLELLHERSAHVVEAAQTAADLGGLALGAGDYRTAVDHFERSHAALVHLGEQAPAAQVAEALSVAYGRMGRFARALAVQYDALDVIEGLEGAAPLRGDAYLNLSSLLEGVADHAAARAALDSAEALYRGVGDTTGVAEARTNTGVIEFRLGHFAGALAAFRDAEAGFAGEELAVKRAKAIANQGDVLLAQGEYTQAQDALERALALQRDAGAAGRPGPVYGTLAELYVAQGRWAPARKAYEQALEEATRRGEADSQALQEAGLARIDLEVGKAPASLEHVRRCIALLAVVGQGLPDGQDADLRGRRADVFETGVRAAVQTGSMPEILEFLERGRAGAFLAALGGRDLAASAAVPPPLLAELDRARARAASTLDIFRQARALRQPRSRTVSLWSAYQAARDALTHLEARVQLTARSRAEALVPPVRPLAQVQADLGAGRAMVLYALHARQAMALVLTHDEARRVDLGDSEEIAAACRALRTALLEDKAVEEDVARLRARLLAPLALPSTIHQILVSPDGELARLPFALLETKATTALVPSATVYGELLSDRTYRGTQVLALGDPDYRATRTARVGARTRGGATLEDLPATKAEVEAVGDVVLLQEHATERGLREALAGKAGRWRAVHFACHGLIDIERTARSALALTAEAPDDGYFTTFEVMASGISADLVVLSACNSGLGRIVRGEGLQGFTRAFLQAGCPRVLCSLWKVDDEATQALMRKFYELWHPKDGSQGLPTAQALRRAQDHVRSQARWQHPRYWAAWVLWGLAD